MAWKCFQKVPSSETKVGEPKEVTCFINKPTTPQQFLEYVAPKLLDFVMHNHIARW